MAEGGARWFGTRESGGFGPLVWQGRAALALYVILVLFALVLYSDVGLIVTVLVIYTVALLAVIVMTSDLKDRIQGPR